MSSGWKNRKRKAAAALVFLIGAGVHFASAQAAKPAALSSDDARLMKYVDKNGGYKDKHGGYYDPNAGTYTDEEGGVVDNWKGYTYKNGDYKAKTGDFWEAATKTFKLVNGEVMKSLETSNKEAITVLRQTVAENGGFDKDFTRKSMMTAIRLEHPLVPAEPQPAVVSREEARLRTFLDKNGGYRDRFGGYYNSTAGTYTDEKGGVLDNWEGYTYKDGSYKSKLGDYYDAPTNTVHFAGGGQSKVPNGSSAADVITVMRQSVEENGRFDKTFIQRAMLGQIQKEHPLVPPKP